MVRRRYQGFTVVPDAIPQPLLAEVQAAFHAAAASAVPGTLAFTSPLHKTPAAVVDEDGVVEITQPYEHHPALQQMLELPKPMAILEALLGEPIRSLRHVHGDRVVHRTLDQAGGVEGDEGGDSAHLFYSTSGHVLPPDVDCDLRWHADGDFLRFTYLIEDLGECFPIPPRVCEWPVTHHSSLPTAETACYGIAS